MEKEAEAGFRYQGKDLDEETRTCSWTHQPQESYEIGSEQNLDQPNQWLPEDILPGFRKFMTEFYWDCHWTARRLLSAMALGIGLDNEDYFASSHLGHNNQFDCCITHRSRG